MNVINSIVNKLKISPIKVLSAVLYGSWARGEETKGFGYRFVDCINPKKHRRGNEIANIKSCVALGFPLDIMLLTSYECTSNFRNHNPLFLDIALVMFTDGKRDFAIGENIMQDGYYDKAVYHFQQAAEKAIKAVLISLVTWSRYPGIDSDKLWIPYEEYTENDALQINKKTGEVLTVTKDFIKWWFKP